MTEPSFVATSIGWLCDPCNMRHVLPAWRSSLTRVVLVPLLQRFAFLCVLHFLHGWHVATVAVRLAGALA